MSDAVDKIGEKLGLGKVEERKEVRGEEEENEISGSSSPMSFETLSIHWANPQYKLVFSSSFFLPRFFFKFLSPLQF